MSKDNTPVSYEELSTANAFQISALVNVLERKGILTKEEVIQEIDRLQKEIEKDAKKN